MMMKKITAFFISMVILFASFSTGATAERLFEGLSLDAAQQYFDTWNAFFQEHYPLASISYGAMPEGEEYVRVFFCVYNEEDQPVISDAQIIPSNARLYAVYVPGTDKYFFEILCVDSALTQPTLDRVFIDTEHKEIGNLICQNSQGPSVSIMSFSLNSSTVEYLSMLDSFTVEITVSGKTKTLNISSEENDLFSAMFRSIAGLKQACTPAGT